MIVAERVPDALAGERIDRVVAMLATVSRSTAASLIAAGGVTLNEVPVAARSTRVAAGDAVRIELAEVDHATPVPDPDVAFRVVHADRDLIVVDKPPGLVVHPGAGNPHGTLADGLLARFPELVGVGDPARPGIVHRLDKDTSGLLVVARTNRAHEVLVSRLAAHDVDRRYLALVWGHPEAPHGLVDAPIGRSARDPTRMAVSARGRPARTGYDVQARFTSPAELALLRCRLETGRTHQIRVHLAAIGHPVVGDARYEGLGAELRCPRTFLHAERLELEHPLTGERVTFTAPLPDDLRAVLGSLA